MTRTKLLLLVGIPLAGAGCVFTPVFFPQAFLVLPDLLFGWAWYVHDTAPRIAANPAAIGLGVLVVALTGGVGHALARSIHGAWRLKWTLLALAVFGLAFAGGLVGVGLARNLAWAASEDIVIRRASASALGGLKTIQTSQAIFREGDKDEDDRLDYGTLEELGRARLVDDVLASGTKQGYAYVVAPSVTTPEFLWWATAAPTYRGGDRTYFTNQSGQVWYTTGRLGVIDRRTCEPPPGVIPSGK